MWGLGLLGAAGAQKGVTLTTSGGNACTSSKGVSKVLESTFITTTSSRAFSRTLCVGEWGWGRPLRARGSLAGAVIWGCRRRGIPSAAAIPVCSHSPRRDWSALR